MVRIKYGNPQSRKRFEWRKGSLKGPLRRTPKKGLFILKTQGKALFLIWKGFFKKRKPPGHPKKAPGEMMKKNRPHSKGGDPKIWTPKGVQPQQNLGMPQAFLDGLGFFNLVFGVLQGGGGEKDPFFQEGGVLGLGPFCKKTPNNKKERKNSLPQVVFPRFFFPYHFPPKKNGTPKQKNNKNR